MLTLIKGGKKEEENQKPAWFKNHEKEKIRKMFESKDNFGKWNQGFNENTQMAERYPGKLGQAMDKYGSYKGVHGKPKEN